MGKISEWIIEKISKQMLKESPPRRGHLSDFNRIKKEIIPGDVLLIEGRSRASLIIKHVTQSPWSHAFLYIGRLEDIKDINFREKAEQGLKVEITPDTQLMIESELGLGTVIGPIDKYKNDHIRILRPRGLSKSGAQHVINFAISRLGREYDVRHVLDLMRFLFPWGLWPRKWRSSLFQHHALQPTKDICSSMIASAFQYVNYPILPFIRENPEKKYELIERNVRLFTPSDFDYSPFFDIIKYPIVPLDAEGEYKNLNWRTGVIMSGSDEDDGFYEEPLE